jgi:NADH:ubiquinone oxidoreductase subunit C
MNDMKELWTDLNLINYLCLLYKIILDKFSFNYNVQLEQINVYKINLNYNSILNLAEVLIFKYQTLRDLTVVNYPGFFKELELHYFFLSYKLNIKFSLKNFINKEDLVISLVDIYQNSN